MGYPSRTFPPCACTKAPAAFKSASETPFRLYPFTMTKHDTDHTGVASTGFRTRDLSSAGSLERGVTEHQPTGLPLWKAIKPGGTPDFVHVLSLSRFFPALPSSYSLRLTRQSMHQHPPEPPFGPMTTSRSAHRSAVAGRTTYSFLFVLKISSSRPSCSTIGAGCCDHQGLWIGWQAWLAQ